MQFLNLRKRYFADKVSALFHIVTFYPYRNESASINVKKEVLTEILADYFRLCTEIENLDKLTELQKVINRDKVTSKLTKRDLHLLDSKLYNSSYTDARKQLLKIDDFLQKEGLK